MRKKKGMARMAMYNKGTMSAGMKAQQKKMSAKSTKKAGKKK